MRIIYRIEFTDFTGCSITVLKRSHRYSKPLSVLIMDLDNFKQINDQMGHDAGDSLLCQFVTTAVRILRGEDVFCRFGGEEFVALLPNASAEQARVTAERLRTAFTIEATTPQTSDNDMPLSMTVSIGIAELAQDEDIEGLLRRADTALYQAKHLGRNRCEYADAIGPQAKVLTNSQPISAENS